MHHRSHDQGEGDLHKGQGSAFSGMGGPAWGGWADPPNVTRKAGGTHPTGKLSCFPSNLK